MPSPPTKRSILVQAGHKRPHQPGHEGQTGAQGEAELVHRIQKRLVQILQQDGRFEPLDLGRSLQSTGGARVAHPGCVAVLR